ncbi:DUF1054 domain-containing protein [Halobacillus rhizosphaerae]|uniref:YktB family protein n=1 Tax=Halobacillus rhizosphaerae TaxID=3064889 RepID=UPI00398B3F28
MSEFQGFSKQDFEVFTIPGLENRMTALREQISPKLEAIAEDLAPDLTILTGDEMHVHVAKHARRSKNPPNDTWAAIAANKRGYKKLPHFQVGLWETHVFIWFAVIYENPLKEQFGNNLLHQKEEIRSLIPEDFEWSLDHTKPETIADSRVDEDKFIHMAERLKTVKKAELLCGRRLEREDERLRDPESFLQLCRNTFETLIPLYRLTNENKAR